MPLTRFRTKGQLLPYNLTYAGGPLSPLSQTYSGTTANVTVGGSKTYFRDTLTPGFKRRVNAGLWANNPMTSVKVTSTPFISSVHRVKTTTPNAAWEDDSGALVSAVFGSLVNGNESDGTRYSTTTVFTDRLARLATINTWANVQASSSQSLVTLAEGHKTWDTIAKRAKQLASVVSAVRKGDVKTLNGMFGKPRKTNYPSKTVVWHSDVDLPITARSSGRTVGRYFHRNMRPTRVNEMNKVERLWLEYRYGWCPIVYDIIDTLKAIHAEDLASDLTQRPFKTAHGKANGVENTSTALISSVGGIQSDGVRTVAHELEIRGYILYRDLIGGWFSRLNDFGLFDVPRAIWELVPLSFVVDWFVPVGNFLAALQPKVGVEILAMGHTTYRKISVRQWCTVYHSNTTTLAWPPLAPLGAADEAVIEVRDRKTSLGTPSIPPLALSLNVKRMFDAAALFKSMR